MSNIIHRPFTYSYKRITIKLVILNILIYLLQTYVFKSILPILALNPINIIKGKAYWQFFTYMFVHANFEHIFFNMLGLLVFGLSVEKRIGSKEFLLFYLLCGTLGGLFSFFIYKLTGNFTVYLLGASGAIYAILFIYAVLFPRSIIYIWGIIPLPAPIMVLIYTIIEIGSEFLGINSGTAHLTHLFGFFAAFLYIRIRFRINPFKLWKHLDE